MTSLTLLPTDFELILVPHPKYESSLCICWENQFYELQSCSLQKYTTWFIEQRISSSQFLYLATIVDPKFIILPYLEKSNGKFSPLDQIIPQLQNAKLPNLSLASQWNMNNICDINDSFGDDCIFYRYNTEKALNWLKSKVQKISKIILHQRILKEERQQPSFVTSFQSAEAASLDKNNADETPTADDLKTAVEIICDYLTDNMSQTLMNEYGLKTGDFNARSSLGKRKADWEVALEQEIEATNLLKGSAPPIPKAEASKVAAPNSAGAGAQKNTKITKLNEAAAKGTKSIQSFFAKK